MALDVQTGHECSTERKPPAAGFPAEKSPAPATPESRPAIYPPTGLKNTPIREWAEEERPREMIHRDGAERLPLAKLLAVILRTGRPGLNAEELSRRLVNTYGSLRRLDAATIAELCGFDGIGPAKAAQIKAALEIGKRLIRERASFQEKVESPDEAIRHVQQYYGPYMRDREQERCCAILLDRKHHPIRHIEAGRGGPSACIVDSREILREAILYSADAIILIHNHPSGDVRPSADDVRLTRRIHKAAGLLDIRLLDHIIIGRNPEDCFSFARSRIV